MADPEVDLSQVASRAEILEAVVAAPPPLVIVGAELPDAEPLDLIQELLKLNARVNTAVISKLSEEEFHAASEGLGVLCRLSKTPGAGEAAGLLQRLVLGIA